MIHVVLAVVVRIVGCLFCVVVIVWVLCCIVMCVALHVIDAWCRVMWLRLIVLERCVGLMWQMPFICHESYCVVCGVRDMCRDACRFCVVALCCVAVCSLRYVLIVAVMSLMTGWAWLPHMHIAILFVVTRAVVVGLDCAVFVLNDVVDLK